MFPAKAASPQVGCRCIPFPFLFPLLAAAAAIEASRCFSARAEALQTSVEETTATRHKSGTPTATATAPGEAFEKALPLPSPRRAFLGGDPEAEETLLESFGRSRDTACLRIFGKKSEPFSFSLSSSSSSPLLFSLHNHDNYTNFSSHPAEPLKVPRPQPQPAGPRPRAPRQDLEPRPRDRPPVFEFDQTSGVLGVRVPRPPEDAAVGDPGGGGGGGGGRGVACSLGDRRRGTLVRLRLGGGEER